LRYDPFAAAAEPDIYHQGHYIGQAKVADLQLNSQLDYRRDYQDRRRS
jgi:hypothetical protein